MYKPQNWHWVGPLIPVAGNFYIVTHFPLALDMALFVLTPLAFGSVALSTYLWKAGEIWQNFEAEWNAPGDSKPKAPVVSNVPYNNNGQQTILQLSQVTKAPKLNNEQKFYRALIDMRNSGLPVDMRESYWLSPINRYGESRDSFVAMKRRGEDCGALCRAGERKNAPHDVADWRKVRLLAGGYSSSVQPPP